jgi:hypothetical protein
MAQAITKCRKLFSGVFDNRLLLILFLRGLSGRFLQAGKGGATISAERIDNIF